MSVNIEIDGLDAVLGNMASLQDGLTNIGAGLMESIETNLMPALIDASSTVWGVRTGIYSSSWNVEIDGNTAIISSTDDPAKVASLEYGWTRGSSFIESTGVLLPTALEQAQTVAEGVSEWLTSQATR